VEVTKSRAAKVPRSDPNRYAASARRASIGGKLNRTLLFIVLAGGALLFMMPLYIMLTISLKTRAEAANTSPWAWPISPTLDNFKQVWSDPGINFLRAAMNTLILAVFPTIGTVLSASVVAFPFARLSFRGRDRLFIVLLSTMMLPGIVTLIPGYVLMAKLGWIDTFKPFMDRRFLSRRRRLQHLPDSPIHALDSERDGRGGQDRWSDRTPSSSGEWFCRTARPFSPPSPCSRSWAVSETSSAPS
jgi:hypothetical protein